MSAAVTIPAPPDLGQKVTTWTQLANQLKIVDRTSCEQASRDLVAIKELQKEADESFDPIIRKAHEAHKEAIAQKKRITDPLVLAETALKSKISEYLESERQAREEEERRLRAEADRLAAEQREAEIEEAEAAGASSEEIEVLAQAPLSVAPVVRWSAPPKVNGISSRELWHAEVTNFEALVKFVAQNTQFRNLLQANPVAIGAMARTLRSAMNVPGVKVWRETTVATRGRA